MGFLLSKPVTRIGREPACDVPLTHDSHVSRVHAEIRREGPQFVVYDLGSVNGTFVNGRQVDKHVLREGDRITVGETHLTLRGGRLFVAGQARARPKARSSGRSSQVPVFAAIALLLVVALLTVLSSRNSEFVATSLATYAPPASTPQPPGTPASTEREIAVSATGGLEYREEGLPFVYIPPNAVEQDTTVRIEQIHDVPDQSNAQPAGPAFDITLAEGSPRAPIEVALPLDITSVDLEKEVFVAYLTDDAGWITLPSWLSDDGDRIHATLDHLTPLGSFFSLFPQNPRITFKQATPNPFQNVGWPPCFKDDLVVRVDAEDPDGEIQKVEIMFHFHTAGSKAVAGLDQFVQAFNGLGLVVMAGDITALMPAAQAAVTLAKSKDPGIAVTGWYEMGEDPDHPGVYYASLDTSRFSTCEDNFDVDATMAGTGIEKIVPDIRVTDDSGRIREDRIEIPVHSGEVVFAIPESPGPSKTDLQGPRPIFEWRVEHHGAADYAQRLVHAKGDSLWDRWWGKETIPLKWNDQTWQPGKDLEPGGHVWGIEVSEDKGFKPEKTTRSTVFHFTVAHKIAALDVSIAPPSGRHGEVFQITVSGLAPDSTSSIGLVAPGSTERKILTNDLPADGRGQTTFSISSTSDMEPGVYTVYVVSIDPDQPGRGEATFELIAVPPTAILAVNGTRVTRSEVENDTGAALSWRVSHNGATVLQRNARTEKAFDLADAFSEPGDYTVVLEIAEASGGAYVPISNRVVITIERPAPSVADFVIEPPPGFQSIPPVTSHLSPGEVELAAWTHPDGLAHVFVRAVVLEPGTSLSEFYDMKTQYRMGNVPNFVNVSAAKIETNGVSAVSSVVVGGNGPEPTRIREHLLVVNGIGWQVAWAAPDSLSKGLMSLLDPVLGSFKVIEK